MGGWMIALSEWNGNMMLMLMAFPSTTTAASLVYRKAKAEKQKAKMNQNAVWVLAFSSISSLCLVVGLACIRIHDLVSALFVSKFVCLFV